MSKQPIAVITCHFNPCGYKRPERNLLRFERMLKMQGVPLVEIRMLYDDQDDAEIIVGNSIQCLITGASRERGQLWQKEAMLNLVIERYADDFHALAWVDADVIFLRDDWAEGTMKELEHFPVVQLFSQAHLLDADSEVSSTVRSTAWHYSTGSDAWRDFSLSHPGFAWAARSELLKKNKLYPYMITGCGDSAMLRGFTGDTSPEFDLSIGRAMADDLQKWADGWSDDTCGAMGFVMGAVAHMYHGSLINRQNMERRYWMKEVEPDDDLYLEGGCVFWTDHALRNKPRLVRGVAEYFQSRREDD